MAENSDYLKEQRGASSVPPLPPQGSRLSRRFYLFPEKEAKIAKEKELGVYKEKKVGWLLPAVADCSNSSWLVSPAPVCAS